MTDWTNPSERESAMAAKWADAEDRVKALTAERDALRAALAAPQPEPVPLDRSCAAEQAIDDYVADYVMEGDDGSHTPTESERFLIKDAIMGLLVDPAFMAAQEKP